MNMGYLDGISAATASRRRKLRHAPSNGAGFDCGQGYRPSPEREASGSFRRRLVVGITGASLLIAMLVFAGYALGAVL
ncbi:MAG: hypothetical protein ACREP1_07605 [Rhodanobacteraceae bacterium]